MSFTESLLNWIGDRIFLYAVYTVVTTVSFTESSLQLIAEHELIYEALEMLASSLQHTAQHTKHERQNFYRLVYQTVRGKMDMPHDQFKGLVFRLLGDKDHGKIF